ncbi:MAG: response regulator [Pseudomonadota bacterium]|nr:response regulator [Pseudomonadota bacterium]
MADKPTVLLVEDSDDDLALATLALAKTGWPHVLVPLRDGPEVFAYLYNGARGTPPAMILLDLKLPKVDGKTALREVRGNPRTTRVPVVVLTSSSLEQDITDSYTLGANSYLRKELDFPRFKASASILMAYWLGLNVPPPGLGAVAAQPHLLQGVSVADAFQEVLPRRAPAKLAPEIVIIDANPGDVRATLEGIAASSVRNPVRTVGTFQDMVDFLRPVGGPPPLLQRNFPRMFILDVDLRDGDGRDVLQALRYRADHHAIIVMFTRKKDPMFISECYRLKVNSVVFKPDDPAAFRDTVRLIAHYWIHLNEPPPDQSWAARAIAHPG